MVNQEFGSLSFRKELELLKLIGGVQKKINKIPKRNYLILPLEDLVRISERLDDELEE